MKKTTTGLLKRRGFLQLAVAGAAAAGVGGIRLADAQSPAATQAGVPASLNDPYAAGDYALNRVCSYIATGAAAELSAEVTEQAKRHILDTMAAIVSGSKLIPGQFAIRYIQAQGGRAEAQVIATRIRTSAINAAFANGMMAHADETDDSHRATLMHPGAAIVPAALAMSEREGASGTAFLRSVVVGYDVGCRTVLALGPDQVLQGSGATPSIGGSMGAAAACAVVSRMAVSHVTHVLAYAVQQASGTNSWMRDQEHVEKAFVFGGMPARNGVTATELAQFGFTSQPDPFSGPDNFFAAFSARPDLSRLTAGLGREYEIMLTDMKRYPVGFPIQAATDAILRLMAGGLVPRDIQSLTVRLPAPGVRTVNDRAMPDVNVQYILAATLIDGTLKFDTAHSLERMKDPAVLEVKKRIVLVEDTELTAQKRTREANVEVRRTDGTILKEHGITRGAYENPMTRDEVEGKARELMAPILGRDRAGRLIQRIWNLEQLANMRELRSLLYA
jgi:2-methylcitrate dehydratase PrpD